MELVKVNFQIPNKNYNRVGIAYKISEISYKVKTANDGTFEVLTEDLKIFSETKKSINNVNF